MSRHLISDVHEGNMLNPLRGVPHRIRAAQQPVSLNQRSIAARRHCNSESEAGSTAVEDDGLPPRSNQKTTVGVHAVSQLTQSSNETLRGKLKGRVKPPLLDRGEQDCGRVMRRKSFDAWLVFIPTRRGMFPG
jgi:hypothetical protein